jgi:hypothetical protein
MEVAAAGRRMQALSLAAVVALPCWSPYPAPPGPPTRGSPSPDVTDATPINMAAGGGKVALVNSTTPLGCNGGSTPCHFACLSARGSRRGTDT